MEFALKSEIPNYAGGLGVLSADLMHSCADLGVQACGVTLMYHVSEDPKTAFQPGHEFKKRPETINIHIEDRNVVVGVWEYIIKGEKGNVPVYFLDTNLPENKRWDRDITKKLYTLDSYTRLCQEAILGIGGVRMLRALGYSDIQIFHMNEGHAAFLTFELLKELDYKDEAVREKCVFTTHTPIPAGHDRFDYKLVQQVLGEKMPWHIKKLAGEKELNTTRLALSLSQKVNAVSKKHREVCQKMFPDVAFESITNGIYLKRWTSESFATLFNQYLEGWEKEPEKLANAVNIPDQEIKIAHQKNKQVLIEFINSKPEFFPIAKKSLKKEDKLDLDTLTISFARRFVPYKRPLFLFSDLERLRALGDQKLQLIFAGPYHPDNEFAMEAINQLIRLGKDLRGHIRIVIFPDYNLEFARLLTQGSDVWLNNPQPPLEASGTSGMKVAVNGGINLSISDGWWPEGYELNPKSGWIFGQETLEKVDPNQDKIDSDALYNALSEIIDCYENKPKEWCEYMKQAITLGTTFNTHHCVKEYMEKMWNI